MNCEKVGNLILTLRKEKHMTQRQLADLMNISDKTISKWERGLGCPDVSLLHSLSEILGVNIEKILLGDLEPNHMDGGNMKKLKFYVCPTCKSTMTAAGDAEISCCGRKLEPLTPQPADEAHRLTVETVENDCYVTCSHEMIKEHYLNFIACVTYDRVLLVKLYPEQDVQVRLPQMGKAKLYVGCSQHGLYVTDSFPPPRHRR